MTAGHGKICGGMASAARANHIPYFHRSAAETLPLRHDEAAMTAEEDLKKNVMKPRALDAKLGGPFGTQRPSWESDIQSALAALQSAGNGSS